MGRQLEGQTGGSFHAGNWRGGFLAAVARCEAEIAQDLNHTGPSHWSTLVCQPLCVQCIVNTSVRASTGAGSGETLAGGETRGPTTTRLALLGAASVPSMHTT